jgi:hypothetical protein
MQQIARKPNRGRQLVRFIGVSIALLLTLITPALAQSAKHQPVFIFGEGLASCGEFLQKAETERKTRPPSATASQIYDSEYAALIMYADGFLTGANLWDVQNSLIGNSTDTLGRMAWIEKYCRAHSLDNFFQALISFRNSLKDEPEFLKDDHEFLKDQHD